MQKAHSQKDSEYSYDRFSNMIADEYIKSLKSLAHQKKIKHEDLIKAILCQFSASLNKRNIS